MKIASLILVGITILVVFTQTVSAGPPIPGGKGIWASTTCAATSYIGGPNKPCSFCDGLVVIQNIIRFAFDIAIPIAVAIIVYGAVILMIAGGSEERVRQSKSIITAAFIGLCITLAAWVIVNTLLHILTGNIALPWNRVTC
ncbi:hypothetical protein HY967_04630 [Candidatus Jorgensenbacteria bacterium]|nr:hypothetical protein [Candidatus Jorgensenbacteria bacterium]